VIFHETLSLISVLIGCYTAYLLPGLGNSLGPLGTLVCSRTVLLRRWLKLCRDSTGTRVAEAGKEGFRKVISPGCSFSIEVRGILRRACDSAVEQKLSANTTIMSRGTPNELKRLQSRTRLTFRAGILRHR
jgi:hypothetical protein